MIELTVIIPNYNGEKYIADCLDSVNRQSIREKIEVIVVDNASKDKSADIVEKNYPDVRLLRLDDNYGFSRAVNEGITVSKGDFVLLLNSDTTSDERMAEALLAAINKENDIFSVSSKMLQAKEPDKIDGCGDLYCALGWAFARGKGKNRNRYQKPCEVFAACGGASIYRKSILNEIGYFDEYHFAYLEDVDMGYRARIMGYKNMYCPDAIVYHIGSAVSGSRYNDFKVRLSSRNNVYLVFKNMPLLQLIINLPFLCVGFGIKAMFFILKGYGRPYLSGIKRGYLLCHEGRHVAYDKRNLKNYIKIQIMLYSGIFKRLADFF